MRQTNYVHLLLIIVLKWNGCNAIQKTQNVLLGENLTVSNLFILAIFPCDALKKNKGLTVSI